MPQPRDRSPYSAIVDRSPLPPLPGGNRIVFWTIVNVEVWDITRPMPRMLLMPPQGQGRFPDVGNWAWNGSTRGKGKGVGHSYDQHPIHVEHEPEAMIEKTLDILQKFTGQRPIGWL